MDFINRYQKFMKGRYGIIDDLDKILFEIYVILLIFNVFISNIIFTIIELILIIIIIYRFLSKKIYIRSNENRKYLKIKNNIVNIFKKRKKELKDDNYIYKRCHKCRTKLKLPLPSNIGIKHSKCPKCRHRNTYLVLRKMKVEIIKKK